MAKIVNVKRFPKGLVARDPKTKKSLSITCKQTHVLDACSFTPGPGCPMPVGDEDGDNIPDEDDLCPDTPEGETANTDGCSPSQIDTDGDTVFDDVDICPNTPTNEIANSVGCSSSQTDIDTDGDGVNDVDANADQLDMCPNTVEADYGEVDENGCAPSQLDTDGDGVTNDLDLCPDTTSGAAVTAEGCIIAGADISFFLLSKKILPFFPNVSEIKS